MNAVEKYRTNLVDLAEQTRQRRDAYAKDAASWTNLSALLDFQLMLLEQYNQLFPPVNPPE